MAWYDETPSDARGWLDLTEIVPMARELIYKETPSVLPTTFLTNFQPQIEDGIVAADAETIYRYWKKEFDFSLTILINNWESKQGDQFQRIAFPLYLKSHFGFGVIDMTTTPITVAIGEPFGGKVDDIEKIIKDVFAAKKLNVEIIVTKHALQTNGSDCSRLSAVMMQHLSAAPNLKEAALKSNEVPAFLKKEAPSTNSDPSVKYNSEKLNLKQREIHTEYTAKNASQKQFFNQFFDENVMNELVIGDEQKKKKLKDILFDGLSTYFNDVKNLIVSLNPDQQHALATKLVEGSKAFIAANTEYEKVRADAEKKCGLGTKEFQDKNIRGLFHRHQKTEQVKQALVKFLFAQHPELARVKLPIIDKGKEPEIEVVSTLKESAAPVVEKGKPTPPRENLLQLAEETIKNAFGRSVTVTIDKTDPNCHIVKKDDDEVLKIYADKLETGSDKQEIFIAMLKIYNAARFVRPPEINCDPKLVATWTAAVKAVFGEKKMYDVKINGTFLKKPEPPKEVEETKKRKATEQPEMPFPMPGPPRPRLGS